MRPKSPFRYPGGKARLAGLIIDLLVEQQPRSRRYVEPFVGGGAVALGVAVRYPGINLILNDLDQRVAAVWSVLSQKDSAPYEKLVRRISDTVPSVDLWRQEKQARSDGSEDDLAFRALFLNRSTFSGNMSYKSGGPIGGYDQSGAWKIDARWKLPLLLSNLELLRDLLTARKVTVLSEPWEGVVQKSGWHYYDPPYMTPSAGQLYCSAFSVDDHIALRNHLRDLASPWVLSYDKDPHGHITWMYSFAQSYERSHSTRVQQAGPQVRVEMLYVPVRVARSS